MNRNTLRGIVAAALSLAALGARAELQDEIQVYDDAINAPGEPGLEMHVNTTPRGRRQPAYPGEVVPHHGWRFTPELSYGLTRSLEAGLYLPVSMTPQGSSSLAGAKLRLKWMPLQTQQGVGSFAGVNVELSRLAARYALPRKNLETRFIVGWRSETWLFAANPIFDFGISDGAKASRPDFNFGLKGGRQVAAGLMAGLEYYSAPTVDGSRVPWQRQDNRLYLALDVDRKPWAFNVAIGRALTTAADRWTVKAIFDIPLASNR